MGATLSNFTTDETAESSAVVLLWNVNAAIDESKLSPLGRRNLCFCRKNRAKIESLDRDMNDKGHVMTEAKDHSDLAGTLTLEDYKVLFKLYSEQIEAGVVPNVRKLETRFEQGEELGLAVRVAGEIIIYTIIAPDPVALRQKIEE